MMLSLMARPMAAFRHCSTRFRHFTMPRALSIASSASLASIIDRYTESVATFKQSAGVTGAPSGREREVFVNSEVRLDHIDVWGFDLDYTLASYNTRLQELVYELAQDYLINILNYPSSFKERKYDPKFAVRGISYDIMHGLLVKMDYHDNVTPHCTFRGTRRLSNSEVKKVYHGMYVSRLYREQKMKALIDMFSMSEACIIANLIQNFVENHTEFSNAAVAEDIAKAIGFVHSSGAMHNEVAVNPAVYLSRNPDLPVLLRRLKDGGKQVFLLTNSGYSFANAVLKYLIGDDWRTYFNVVIVDANKPSFYNSSKPFREVDTSRNRMKWDEVTALLPGRVYAQGSVSQLMSFQGWKGSRVMYIGDNLLSDTIVPRKTHGWVTGIILPELERHMVVHDSDSVRAVDTQMACLDEIMRLIQCSSLRKEDDGTSILTDETLSQLRPFLSDRGLFVAPKAPFLGGNGVTEYLDILETERNAWRREKQHIFHRNFGSEFTSGTSPTLFAMTVLRYVDLYTSRVTNFLQYPADYRFYPECKLLPHQQPQVALLQPPESPPIDD